MPLLLENGLHRPFLLRRLQKERKVAFSEEQIRAYNLCVQSGQNLSLIQGRAGVGKSYVLNGIRMAHEEDGYRVIGLAPTNKVATDLMESGFSEAKTCHSFLFSLKNCRTKHPAFKKADSYKRVFEEGLKRYGEEGVIQYWNEKRELFLALHEKKIKEVENTLHSLILSYHSPESKILALKAAFEDPDRALNRLTHLQDTRQREQEEKARVNTGSSLANALYCGMGQYWDSYNTHQPLAPLLTTLRTPTSNR